MVIGGLLSEDRRDDSADAAQFDVEHVVNCLSRSATDGKGDVASRLN